MLWFFLLGVFLFGLCAGSFLNVCIYRLPAGKSLVNPGSFCPKCNTAIKAYDNIPVLSFLILGAKCRSCKVKISWQYPAIELLTALMLVWLAWDYTTSGYSLPVFSAYIYLTLGLIVLTFVDAKLEIIPDEISLIGIPVALILSIIFPELHKDVPFVQDLLGKLPGPVQGGLASLAGIIIGGGSLWLTGFVAKVLLKKDAMGFGDVKLMAAVGGLLGWLDSLVIFFLACGLGSAIGIVIIIKTKSRRIPFGPFLAAGTWFVMLYGPEIIFFITDTYPRFIRNLLGMG